MPKSPERRTQQAAQIGANGFYLLDCIYADSTPVSWLTLPAVEVLRQVCLQQYYAPGETIQLREAKDSAPSSIRIRSPYDVQARLSAKYSRSCTGYKVHFSESCDNNQPRLITNLETTVATDQDQLATPQIYALLMQK